MESVATWKRVSDDKQDVESQRRVLDSHVAAHGYHVVKEFELPDTSAFKGKQAAALAEILRAAEAGTYRKVIAVSSSRFLRSKNKIAIGYLIELDNHQGRLIALDNPLYGDLHSDGGWHVTLAASSGDYNYSVNISNAVKRGNAAIDARGGFRGGVPPWGWKTAGEKRAKYLVIDLDQAEIIRALFTWISTGMSVPQAKARLEHTYGVRKMVSSITAAIRRPMYRTGRYEVTDHEGVRRVHQADPIVTADLWRAANASLDSRNTAKPHGSARPRNDFSGVVYCGQCLRVAYRSWYGSKKVDGKRTRRRVYRCTYDKIFWDAGAVDEQIERIMSSDTRPEFEVVTVAPAQHKTEQLEQVEEQLRELPLRNLAEDEEDDERARLRAERRRLQDLPDDDQVRQEARKTGRTLGQAWDAMGHAERLAWLRHHPVEIQLRLMEKGYDVRVERVVIPQIGRPLTVYDLSNLPHES